MRTLLEKRKHKGQDDGKQKNLNHLVNELVSDLLED
jgi:hypothetical protein